MNAPRLRFSEFNEEWEEKKLRDICKINPNSGRLPEKFIYIDLESVENGVLLKENYINLSDAPSRAQRLLNKDDILFQTVRPYQKNNFYFDKVDIRFQYVASTGYAQLRTYEDSKFLYQYLHTQKFVDSILEKCTGTSYPAINSSDLSKIIIYKPSLEEQQKIGDFFMLLDKRIEQQEQKIALLKDYKKAMMQKIFSQKIRFKDENGNNYPDWEEKKLGEVCNITTGKLDANAMSPGGKYRFYTCAKEFYNIDYFAFDTEALLISGNGANVGYIHYYNGKFNAYQRTYVLDNFSQNTLFIKYFLDEFLYKRINSEKKDGNTPYIVIGVLLEMKLLFPILSEQEKISILLFKIDNNIEKQEIILEKLKSKKKSLLYNMFM